MHDLEARTRAVICNWELGNRANALNELDQCIRRLDHDRECAAPEIARAHELYASDTCEISDAPLVCRGEGRRLDLGVGVRPLRGVTLFFLQPSAGHAPEGGSASFRSHP